MPIYEYNCEHCSYKFDKLVMSHNTHVKCPLCCGRGYLAVIGKRGHRMKLYPGPALERAMKGHVLDQKELVGTYQKGS